MGTVRAGIPLRRPLATPSTEAAGAQGGFGRCRGVVGWLASHGQLLRPLAVACLQKPGVRYGRLLAIASS